MRTLSKKILRFLLAEDGPTAVEYAMMLMLVFLVCISVVILLGQGAAGSFDRSSLSIQDAFTR